MPRASIAARILPVLAVGAVLAFSFLAGGRVSLNARLVSCAGYGAGYGYTSGPPSVTGVVPASGSTSGGTSVVLTGQGFCNFTSAVHFGATAAPSFVINSDTSITALSPAHAVGTVDVTVTNAAGTSATSSADHFTYGIALYFNWYDHASAGVNADTIHITNTNASTASGTINLGGATSLIFHVNAGQDGYFTFPQGTIGGPVSVISDMPVISTLRAWYYKSFNETPARSESAAATLQYFPWYDHSSAGVVADTIHIANESGSTASGSIAINVGGVAPISFSVANGADSYFTFPQGTIGGPVTITSDHPVLASLRAWYYQSFNETFARSTGATIEFFPWYDKASAGVNADTIHITNVSGSTATGSITINVGGVAAVPFSVLNGADSYFTFPAGTIGGPVTITSDQPVITSLRAWYYQSFNEVAGRTAAAAAFTQYFPWYDLSSPGMNADTIHITNESGTTANITLTLGATGFIMAAVPTGTDAYFTFGSGAIGGPVTIFSDQPVLASLRAWYYQSFNEVPGYQ